MSNNSNSSNSSNLIHPDSDKDIIHHFLPGSGVDSTPISCNLVNKIDIMTIRESLLKGIFWNMFISRKAPPDGHCLIHSMHMCLKHCFSDERLRYTYRGILDKLRTESLHNMPRYLPAIEDCSLKMMVLEMVN